jgi:hypothetical protein
MDRADGQHGAAARRHRHVNGAKLSPDPHTAHLRERRDAAAPPLVGRVRVGVAQDKAQAFGVERLSTLFSMF